jgi:hypothetical protein
MSCFHTEIKLSGILRTATPGSTQLRRLSSKVCELALQFLPNKRGNDPKVVDNQGSAVIKAQKLLASANRVQLLAVAADEQKAYKITAMWLQSDRLKGSSKMMGSAVSSSTPNSCHPSSPSSLSPCQA